jgi:shikimate kinase
MGLLLLAAAMRDKLLVSAVQNNRRPLLSADEKREPLDLDPEVLKRIRKQSIVLVGLMGAGKTTVGRRLATALNMPFMDADHEIEGAAGLSVAEIFEKYGEDQFRDGERKVIARLIEGEPCVLATGGGAFMNDETRALIKKTAVSVWLKAELELLLERVMRRDTRPLLKTGDPRDILGRLMDERYPVYSEASVVVESGEGPHTRVVAAIIEGLAKWHGQEDAGS